MDINDITPIERHGNLLFKRDDLFEFNGMHGAKVRAAVALMTTAKNLGYKSATTVGAKSSPQVNICATVGQKLGLKVYGHTTTAPLEYDMIQAKEKGATIIQNPYGYTNVLIKRAQIFAEQNNSFYVPFGMDDRTSVMLTKNQVKSLLPYKDEIKRIVIVAGSGINLSGLILGLTEEDWDVPVIAVMVGHKPHKTIQRYTCENFEYLVNLVEAKQNYNEPAEFTNVNGVEVDSTYEGKCIPFLQPGDLFWIIGKKESHVQGKSITI